MATKPTLLEPTLALEEEFDEDDESDIYEFEVLCYCQARDFLLTP